MATGVLTRVGLRAWLGVLVVGLVGIWVLDRHYTQLQSAPSAFEFVRRTGDHSGRAIAAGLSDCLFAVGYGAFGVLALRRLGRGRAVALVATLLIVIGAAADVVEDLILVRNVAVGSQLGNDGVAVMQIFGTVKWLALVGYVVLAVLALLHVQTGMRDRRLARMAQQHDDPVDAPSR